MGMEQCVKFKISVDEKWPVYRLDYLPSNLDNQFEVEISEELYYEYMANLTRYNLWQQKLGLIYEQSRTNI